jgi:hypothetical protein
MGGPAPEWVQVFPYPIYIGELDGEKKTWVTDALSQQSCVDYFALRGNDLVIDYEHSSDKDSEAPAAGRIVELRAGAAAGLLARVEWTDRARRQIESGEYYYDSPSFFWSRSDGRIYGLRHVALTNNPGSWNRPYITDHTALNYFTRTNQRSGASLPLVCAVSNNKGGKRVRSNVLESLRQAVGRKANVTARELRTDLMKLAELVPDTDERIFLADGAEPAGETEPGTIAQLIGREQFGPAESPAQAGDAAASQSALLSPIALALGVETDDPRVLALAVMSLKASSISAERVRDLEQRLAEAATKSGEERIQIEIARQRAAGKQITPAFEADLVRVAKHDLGLAMSSLAGLQLTSIDLATQSDQPAPTVERLATARQRAADTADRLPTHASDALKASTSAYEETLAIASEKGLSYPEANQLRLASQRAA